MEQDRDDSMARAGLFPVHAGFLPLTDAAVLVAARDKGFAAQEGIDLVLVRETSWASIRDRMAVGHFEVAHMLAPMPIAAALRLSPIALDVVAPMALGLGGNAITVSAEIAAGIRERAPGAGLDAGVSGRALKDIVDERRTKDCGPLRFAVVHPHSGHNYELRYWMAACGIAPDKDVEILVVPPPLMPDALARGQIDGFCVGEPWNSVAVMKGIGELVTTKAAIWKSSPEKVLGVSKAFASSSPDRVEALIRALYRAAEWCEQEGNKAELASLLSAENRINVAADYLLPGLTGEIHKDRRETIQMPDFFIPFARAATFPWKSHALWFYSQMVRWGHAEWDESHVEKVTGAYAPSLYREALAPLGVPVPAANAKVEGALKETMPVGAGPEAILLGPDGFFDGQTFDPEQIVDYLDKK